MSFKGNQVQWDVVRFDALKKITIPDYIIINIESS